MTAVARIAEDHLRELFDGGKRRVALKIAAGELQELAGVARSAAYTALKVVDGRFSNLLTRNEDGLIGLRPSTE